MTDGVAEKPERKNPNRFPRGIKYVAIHPVRKTYLRYDCNGETKDRFKAWVGNHRQADNMKAAYPYAAEFQIIMEEPTDSNRRGKTRALRVLDPDGRV